MRRIFFGEGTCMGDTLYLIKTNAPKELLESLLKKSNDAYINGNGYDDVPVWRDEIAKKGYTFDFIDNTIALNYGTWTDDTYPDVKEEYIIENQPELACQT